MKKLIIVIDYSIDYSDNLLLYRKITNKNLILLMK